MSKIIKTGEGDGRKKRRMVILVVIIGLVLIAGGVTFYYFRFMASGNSAYACSDSTLKKAGSNLVNPINVPELSKTVAGIEATPGYEKNVDCVYITTYYQVSFGSPAQAQTELDKLNKVFDPQKGYGAEIAKSALSPAALQSEINSEKSSPFGDSNDLTDGKVLTPAEEGAAQ